MSLENEDSSTKRRRGDDLASKLGSYGASVVRIVQALPENSATRHIRDQLLRAGTAAGAHYAEARNAQSRDDFIHKIALAAKEARESLHWLHVVDGAGLLEESLGSVLEEAEELVAKLASSLNTARGGRS